MAGERFVLDASVAIDWFLPGGGSRSRYAEGILERIGAEELLPTVPDLWHYELGSVLIAAKRDKRISAAKLRASQLAIRELRLETLAVELDAAELIDLSQRYLLDFELARGNKKAMIRTAWIVRSGESAPSLLTCYVL